MAAQLALLFPEPAPALPRWRRRPAFRITMHAPGGPLYVTTFYGSEARARRYTAKLEARTGRRHEARGLA